MTWDGSSMEQRVLEREELGTGMASSEGLRAAGPFGQNLFLQRVVCKLVTCPRVAEPAQVAAFVGCQH